MQGTSLTMAGWRWLSVAVLLVVSFPSAAQQESGAVAVAPAVRQAPLPVEVLGAARPLTIVVRRWASEVTARIESLVGYPLAREGFLLRIVLESVPGDAGRVVLTQGVVRGLCVQRILIENEGMVSRESTDEILCRAMLARYILQAAAAGDAGRPDWVRRVEGVALVVPEWLVRGMARNLQSAWRAEDSDAMLARLAEGQLPTVAAILETAAEPQAEGLAPVIVRPEEGVLVRWLLSAPPGAPPPLAGCFRLIAAGLPLDAEALGGLMAGGLTPTALEEQWRLWVQEDRFRIIDPGGLRGVHLDRLRDALLLKPGGSGIPLEGVLEGEGGLEVLIPWRGAPWLPGTVAEMTLRLRTLALGRDARFAEVVERYCEFLKSLSSRESTEEVESRLRTAEGQFNALRDFLTAEDANQGVMPGSR